MQLASLADFYRYGLRADAFASTGRVVRSVDVDADAFVVPMHGLQLNDPLRFEANPSGTLPEGLSGAATYYAIPLGDDVFAVAAAPDGLAVDVTALGTGPLAVLISPTPRIRAELDACEQRVRASLVAYDLGTGEAPSPPYPLEAVQVCCQLAAFNLLGTVGVLNPQDPGGDMLPIKARYDAAVKRLAEWEAGERMPVGFVDASVLDENAPDGWADIPRDWTQGGAIQ